MDKVFEFTKTQEGLLNLVAPGILLGGFTVAEFIFAVDIYAGTILNGKGTYKVDEFETDNVTITKSGITLEGTTIPGNLTIADGVGNGDVTIKDVTVKGGIVARGCGKNTFKMLGSSSTAELIASNMNHAFRVFAESAKAIHDMIISSGRNGVTIDAQCENITSYTTAPVLVTKDAKSVTAAVKNSDITIGPKATVGVLSSAIGARGATLTVQGAVDALNAAAPKTYIKALNGARLGIVTVEASANGSTVFAAKGSEIKELRIMAENVTVIGSGNVMTATITGNGVSIGTGSTTVIVADGVKDTTVGNNPVNGGTNIVSPVAPTAPDDLPTGEITTQGEGTQAPAVTTVPPPYIPPTPPTTTPAAAPAILGVVIKASPEAVAGSGLPVDTADTANYETLSTDAAGCYKIVKPKTIGNVIRCATDYTLENVKDNTPYKYEMKVLGKTEFTEYEAKKPAVSKDHIVLFDELIERSENEYITVGKYEYRLTIAGKEFITSLHVFDCEPFENTNYTWDKAKSTLKALTAIEYSIDDKVWTPLAKGETKTFDVTDTVQTVKVRHSIDSEITVVDTIVAVASVSNNNITTDYPSLTDAVEAANNIDSQAATDTVITVKRDTTMLNGITINKPMTINGNGKTVEVQYGVAVNADDKTAILVSSNDVIIKELKVVINSGTDIFSKFVNGITVVNMTPLATLLTGIELLNNTITVTNLSTPNVKEKFFGIYAVATDITMTGNIVTARDGIGVEKITTPATVNISGGSVTATNKSFYMMGTAAAMNVANFGTISGGYATLSDATKALVDKLAVIAKAGKIVVDSYENVEDLNSTNLAERYTYSDATTIATTEYYDGGWKAVTTTP